MPIEITQHQIRLTKNSNFETILTVREIQKPTEVYELKFETMFANAKNPNARQTKAQFFIEKEGLLQLQKALSSLAQV